MAIRVLRLSFLSATALPPPRPSFLRCSCTVFKMRHLHPPIVTHFADLARDTCLAVTIAIFYNATLRTSRLCSYCWMHH